MLEGEGLARAAVDVLRRRQALGLFIALALAALALGAIVAAPAGAALPAPTLTAPPVAGVSSATPSFTVTWSATPPAAGVTWDVQYREATSAAPAEGDWRWFARATTLTGRPATGVPGHTYAFRARTLQNGVSGRWSAEKPTVVPYDQQSGPLFTAKYSSGWRSSSAKTAYQGSTQYASARGRTAMFTFAGRALSLLAPTGPTKGKVQVKVRNQSGSSWSAWATVKTLDLYTKAGAARRLFALKTWSAAATRQVQFVVTGKKNRRSKAPRVDLDGIVVRDTVHPSAPITVAVTPTQPAMGFEEQQQFTAAVRNSLNPAVTWHCYRIGNSGDDWFTTEAGSITSAGLYTSTDVPSQDVPGAGPIRRYLVQAVSEADPTAPYGTGATFVAVTPGPAPQVTSLSATSGSEDATITLHGTGFVNHSWPPEVKFGGRLATMVGTPTATQVSARVPSDWFTRGTTASTDVWVSTCGQESNGTAFTVTGLLPSPPDLSAVAMAGGGYVTDNASPGDTISVYGVGFSHTAAANVFDFGGQTATATSWTDQVGATPERVIVTIPAAAPIGATIRARRSDGRNAWCTPPAFTVVAKAVVTLAAGSFDHLIDPAGVNQYASPNAADTWILHGSGFKSLRLRSYMPAGTFNVEMTAGGQTWTVEATALSDTIALCPTASGVWGAVGAGDTLSVSLRGMELHNGWSRTSGSLTVPVAAEAVYGGTHSVMVPFADTTLEISKGDMVQLHCTESNQPGAPHGIAAAGFWAGTLPMRQYAGSPYSQDCANKLLHFPAAGTYTVVDTTAGTTLTVVVKEGGASDEQMLPGVAPWTSWWTEDLVMAGGGARVTIPAGTLVPEANYPIYGVRIAKLPTVVTPFDPTLDAFGDHYQISLGAKHLYHPITVTLPYDPAGRFGQPGFCLYDSTSGGYYRLGGTVDGVDHTVTFTIPAGAYPETMPAGGPAPAAVAPGRAAPETAARRAAPAGAFAPPAAFADPIPWTGDQPLPDMPLDKLFDSTAVVSSNTPPGVLTDEAKLIRVEYCNEPTSTSYVSDAFASEVLAEAQATYTGLQGHGWSVPSKWVAIHVRDLGPIAPHKGIGIQGATTKAVFGQPYVYVNSRCATGTQLDTAVAHEMGHVFERQLTTNISTKWIDEAVAEWAAFDTLGGGADLSDAVEQGNDFAAVQVPTGFDLGYSPEQAYAAGAFIIWIAQHYGPAAVLSIYDQLVYSPSNWFSSYPVLGTATGGISMADLAAGFGAAYWKQEYAPVKGLTLASAAAAVEKLPGWNGVSRTDDRPPYSSFRVSVTAIDGFKAALTGSDLYVSATGLAADQTVEVYGDTAAVASPPGTSLVKIDTLTSLTPGKFIGTFGSYGCYRFIVLNRAAAATVGLKVEPVHVDSVAPLSAPAGGGTSVTLSGHGFGTMKGYVTVGASTVQDTAIMAWSDTSITFALPNMTGHTGAQDVVAHPTATVKSNPATLTLN